MFVNHALNHFRRNPNSDMVSLSPTDGGGFSQSAESRKLGSISDAVYGMVNEVAREVAKEFPGKIVGCYAYRETAVPPSFALEDNVYVEVATLFNMSQYSTADLLKMWPKHVKNMGAYRYFSYYDAGGSDIPGGPISSINWATSTVSTDYNNNVAALFAQSFNAFAMQMRGYLVAARLMWNPQEDVETILADFYQKAYGRAAAPMKRFHERLSKDSKAGFNLYVLGAAHRELDEATQLAKGHPQVLARLGDLKLYMRWIYLRYVSGSTPSKTPAEKAQFKENYIAMMEAASQIAPTYMAQSNMIFKNTGRTRAAGQGDIFYIAPWQRINKRYAKIPGDHEQPSAWANAKPATPESIEAGFQDTLKLLPDREIPTIEYDYTTLVPVEFPRVPALSTPPAAADEGPGKRSEYYQHRSPLYFFYSLKGEPIELEMRGGMRFIGGPPARWSVSEPDGKGGWKLYKSGEIIADKSVQTVSVKVPKKGLYAVRFDGGGAAGYFSYGVDKPVSITASGAKDYRAGFVYVPKNTREIWVEFKQMNGGSQSLLQPDGKIAKVFNSGVYIIPVPPGMDGQLWRMAPQSKFRFQTFFNIPNVAAPSPETLMVPRDVAVRDGLKIRE